MAREEVNERLIRCSPSASNDCGPSCGFGTFQKTFELSQFGRVVQLPEVFRLLCQIFT